ncbi:glycoside hydrolase family 6 protein [Cellulomonas dongxiuzhuiae]|uniref:glycoside hydrolase family 6 protein n=1 Tax=Cellulomonas dongxiuzhuiae TaxID=2819979 RepID=UPI001AAFB6AF|nr:glycoside hydrolase family 6 protein [Cellulomonas dongxiuzhuiae]MBO3088183.1 glycoside hydrolase family 6 protein [Cellulomonas dongxiuzhuiae]
MPPRTKAAPAAGRKLVAALAAGAVVAAGVTALTSTAASAAAGCRADYAISSQWPGGFGGTVTVTNLGDPLSSWDLRWSFPNGQTIQSLWNGQVSSSGSQVTVTNSPWNGSVPTNGTIQVGFNGSWSGANGAPTSFTLNGTTCTGGVTGPTQQPTQTPSSTPRPTQSPTPSRTPTQTPSPQPTQSQPPVSSSDFYVDPTTSAYAAWQAASGNDKNLLAKIALTPQALWIGDWATASATQEQVRDYTGRARAAGKTALLVVYAIPGRDCGSYSGGGVSTSEYARWIDTVAAGIQGNPWVILEPDALAQLGDCDGQGDRVGFLQYAAKSLTAKGARVYIDAGNSAWLSASEAANRLNRIGFSDAVGFSLNVSNYRTTAEAKAYGQQISQLTGGKRFVIDTSRNGNGATGSEWCNPSGRALGERPTKVNDGSGLDALLWIKRPGESDGTCNGGPTAGAWWQAMALELARNARW